MQQETLNNMRVVVLEPLGMSHDALEEMMRPLADGGATIRIYDDRPENRDETVHRLHGADVAVIANMPFPADVIDAAPQLRFLAVAFTGVNHVDIDACRRRNVAVSNAAGFSTESVAELTVGLIIGLLRRVVTADTTLRSGGTNQGLFGHELNGKTVGIVGTGAIGRRVATVLSAFGVRLFGYNRTHYPEMERFGMQYLPLDDLLPAADIITVHVALTAETQNLLSASRIATMKRGAYVVNVARGAVVDSEALALALKDGRLSGVAADVFETEPPIAEDHPLVNAPNTLLLPHVAFGTQESFQKRAAIVVDNIQGWASGTPRRVVC